MKRFILAGASTVVFLGAAAHAQVIADPPPEIVTMTPLDGATQAEAEEDEDTSTASPGSTSVDPDAQAHSSTFPDAQEEAGASGSGLAAREDAAGAVQIAEGDADDPSGVLLEDVNIPLPEAVAEVVEAGDYSTEDLIAAQLAAIRAS